MVEPYGFGACWSTPILAHSGKPLGSFAMYYREPGSPTPAEIRALDLWAASDSGRRASFHFTLPCEVEPMTAQKESHSQSA